MLKLNIKVFSVFSIFSMRENSSISEKSEVIVEQ